MKTASVTPWIEKTSSLNKKGCRELTYLNFWSSVVGGVWKKLQDAGLYFGGDLSLEVYFGISKSKSFLANCLSNACA